MNNRNIQKLMAMQRPMIKKVHGQQYDPSRPDFYKDTGKFRDGSARSAEEIKREQYREEFRSMKASEKDRIHNRIKDLEEQVKSRMMPKNGLWPGKDQGSLQDNAQELVKREFDPAYVNKVNELKELRKRLNPDDPNSGNIENIRPGGEGDKLAKWV